MKDFYVDVDLGHPETTRKYKGKHPTEDDFDVLIRADDVDEDFRVWGPEDVGGNRDLLTAIKRRPFSPDEYETVSVCLDGIRLASSLRGAQSGPWLPEDLAEIGVEGVDYIFKGRDRNMIFLKKTTGEGFRDVAVAKEIDSGFIGYRRGRFTGKVAQDGYSREHPEVLEGLFKMNEVCARAYAEVAPREWANQLAFAQKGVPPEFRLNGLPFTSMSVNRYNAEGTTRMGYHVDAGDVRGALTCIAVFHYGAFDGAYFCLPQHRVAVAVGNGDVMVGDSHKQHGVTPIRGEGTRISCVTYCDARLR